MKHIKIFEEFRVADNNEEKQKFSDNEINYLKSKSDFRTVGSDSVLNGQRINKFGDGWYVLNKTYKCSSLQSAIALSLRIADFVKNEGPGIIDKIIDNISQKENVDPEMIKSVYRRCTFYSYKNVLVLFKNADRKFWYDPDFFKDITFMGQADIELHLKNALGKKFDKNQDYIELMPLGMSLMSNSEDREAVINELGFKDSN